MLDDTATGRGFVIEYFQRVKRPFRTMGANELGWIALAMS